MSDKPTTTTFVRRPVFIEAFQMTRERRWNNGEWPEWLNRAWNGEDNGEGSVWCDVNEPHATLYVGTDMGVAIIEWGDWIVRDKRGRLDVCKPAEFEALYSRTDKPTTAELREALGFYADERLYESESIDIGVGEQSVPLSAPIYEDSGRTARAALAKEKP